MRKMILDTLLMLMPLFAFAGNDDVLGQWKTHVDDSIVEMYMQDGLLYGKVIWMEKSTDKDGEPFRDVLNKDKSLRERPIIGMDIIEGMKPDGKEWKGGKVYDPESGNSYDCRIWLDEGKLHVRGFIGPFGKTLKWKRADGR